jgi:histone H3/H4
MTKGGRGKGVYYGKGKGKYYEKNIKKEKKRNYVFTSITLKAFLKNNDISTRISKEAYDEIEILTKEYVLNIINSSANIMAKRNGKTLSGNDVMKQKNQNFQSFYNEIRK